MSNHLFDPVCPKTPQEQTKIKSFGADLRKLPTAEVHLCRVLFALMAGALMMTMRATGSSSMLLNLFGERVRWIQVE